MQAIKALSTLDVGKSLGVSFLQVFQIPPARSPHSKPCKNASLWHLSTRKGVHQFAVNTTFEHLGHTACALSPKKHLQLDMKSLGYIRFCAPQQRVTGGRCGVCAKPKPEQLCQFWLVLIKVFCSEAQREKTETGQIF